MAAFLKNLAIFLLIIASTAIAAPPCPVVIKQLSDCTTYIEGEVPDKPTSGCCAGVRTIVGEANDKQDQTAICNCIKEALSSLGHSVIPSRIAHLPKKCGLKIDFPPIDAHYDCSKIYWKI